MERKMFFEASPDIFKNAYWLRNHMTQAEKLLWEELRNNKMGIRFKAQHPMIWFIADLYSFALRLVIEIDGPIHESKKEYDQERTAKIEETGNTVIRFTNEEVLNEMDKVLQVIKSKMIELAFKGTDSDVDTDGID